MSDAVFESQHSEAAWTALGDRMRKNRLWLLLMFVALGLYMAAQSWARMRRDGVDLEALTSNVALTGAAPAPTHEVPPQERPAAARKEDGAAPSQRKRSPVGDVGHAPRTAVEGQANRLARELTGRPQDAPAKQRGPRGNDASSPPTRPPASGQKASAATPAQPPGEIEAFSESVGEWLAQWQRQQEDSRRAGLRIVASAVAKYARMPSRAANVPAESQPAPPTIGPSDTHAPHVPASKATEPTASEGPQLPSAKHSGLSIHNPTRSGGAVRYLVNGQDHTLRPGESQELPAGQWLIEFDRGGDHGDAAHTLASGSYRFEITAKGWELLSGE